MSFINSGQHISTVLERSRCDVHGAPEGIPCWHIPKGGKGLLGYYAGACGNRIHEAGYNGIITPFSLRRYAPGGRDDARRKRS